MIYGNTYEELQGKVGTRSWRSCASTPASPRSTRDLKLNKPQLSVKIDRDKAAGAGRVHGDHRPHAGDAARRRHVTRYKHEGKQYDVVVQMEDDKRRQPSDLTSIYVRGNDGTADPAVEPGVAPGDGGAEGAESLQQAARRDHQRRTPAGLHPRPGARPHRPGRARGIAEDRAPISTASRASSASRAAALYVTFALALVIIYLVLAAQFESFVGPLVIMFTVPLAMTGALAAPS